MAIVRDTPPAAPSKAKTPARKAGSGEAVVYEKEARAPKGRQAVYVDTLTKARAVQAAAELGMRVDDMAEAAMRDYLKKEAAALFQREFEAAQREDKQITTQRWEFQKTWRAPAWSRE